MATLNVKNLPDGLYRKLRARAKKQRRSIAQEVTEILSEALEPPKRLSILAAALSAGCSVFLTNDRKLPAIPGLSVLQLSDYA